MGKSILTGVSSALVAALILHLVLPAILGVVLAVIVSGLTILDPLYAEARLSATWSTLGTVLTVQALHTFVTAVATGGAIAFLASRLPSAWLYPAGALLSAALHYALFFLFAAGLSMVAPERNSGLVWGISLTISTLVGPIIGLITVYMLRRGG